MSITTKIIIIIVSLILLIGLVIILLYIRNKSKAHSTPTPTSKSKHISPLMPNVDKPGSFANIVLTTLNNILTTVAKPTKSYTCNEYIKFAHIPTNSTTSDGTELAPLYEDDACKFPISMTTIVNNSTEYYTQNMIQASLDIFTLATTSIFSIGATTDWTNYLYVEVIGPLTCYLSSTDTEPSQSPYPPLNSVQNISIYQYQNNQIFYIYSSTDFTNVFLFAKNSLTSKTTTYTISKSNNKFILGQPPLANNYFCNTTRLADTPTLSSQCSYLYIGPEFNSTSFPCTPSCSASCSGPDGCNGYCSGTLITSGGAWNFVNGLYTFPGILNTAPSGTSPGSLTIRKTNNYLLNFSYTVQSDGSLLVTNSVTDSKIGLATGTSYTFSFNKNNNTYVCQQMNSCFLIPSTCIPGNNLKNPIKSTNPNDYTFTYVTVDNKVKTINVYKENDFFYPSLVRSIMNEYCVPQNMVLASISDSVIQNESTSTNMSPTLCPTGQSSCKSKYSIYIELCGHMSASFLKPVNGKWVQSLDPADITFSQTSTSSPVGPSNLRLLGNVNKQPLITIFTAGVSFLIDFAPMILDTINFNLNPVLYVYNAITQSVVKYIISVTATGIVVTTGIDYRTSNFYINSGNVGRGVLDWFVDKLVNYAAKLIIFPESGGIGKLLGFARQYVDSVEYLGVPTPIDYSQYTIFNTKTGTNMKKYTYGKDEDENKKKLCPLPNSIEDVFKNPGIPGDSSTGTYGLFPDIQLPVIFPGLDITNASYLFISLIGNQNMGFLEPDIHGIFPDGRFSSIVGALSSVDGRNVAIPVNTVSNLIIYIIDNITGISLQYTINQTQNNTTIQTNLFNNTINYFFRTDNAVITGIVNGASTVTNKLQNFLTIGQPMIQNLWTSSDNLSTETPVSEGFIMPNTNTPTKIVQNKKLANKRLTSMTASKLQLQAQSGTPYPNPLPTPSPSEFAGLIKISNSICPQKPLPPMIPTASDYRNFNIDPTLPFSLPLSSFRSNLTPEEQALLIIEQNDLQTYNYNPLCQSGYIAVVPPGTQTPGTPGPYPNLKIPTLCVPEGACTVVDCSVCNNTAGGVNTCGIPCQLKYISDQGVVLANGVTTPIRWRFNNTNNSSVFNYTVVNNNDSTYTLNSSDNGPVFTFITDLENKVFKLIKRVFLSDNFYFPISTLFYLNELNNNYECVNNTTFYFTPITTPTTAPDQALSYNNDDKNCGYYGNVCSADTKCCGQKCVLANTTIGPQKSGTFNPNLPPPPICKNYCGCQTGCPDNCLFLTLYDPSAIYTNWVLDYQNRTNPVMGLVASFTSVYTGQLKSGNTTIVNFTLTTSGNRFDNVTITNTGLSTPQPLNINEPFTFDKTKNMYKSTISNAIIYPEICINIEGYDTPSDNLYYDQKRCQINCPAGTINCGGTCISSDNVYSDCTCRPHFSGDNCKIQCGGNGIVVDGSCVCDPYFSGGNCEIQCGGNGTVKNGACVCKPLFSGANCQTQCVISCNPSVQCGGSDNCGGFCQFTTLFMSNPNLHSEVWFFSNQPGVPYQVFQSSSNVVLANGENQIVFTLLVPNNINDLTQPMIVTNITGPNTPPLLQVKYVYNFNKNNNTYECQQMVSTLSTSKCSPVVCNNRGAIGASGTCVCTGNWTGANCDQCVAHYSGPACNIQCNGHGSIINGKCACSGNFDPNTDCLSCLKPGFDSTDPTCTKCNISQGFYGSVCQHQCDCINTNSNFVCLKFNAAPLCICKNNWLFNNGSNIYTNVVFSSYNGNMQYSFFYNSGYICILNMINDNLVIADVKGPGGSAWGVDNIHPGNTLTFFETATELGWKQTGSFNLTLSRVKATPCT